MIDPKLALAKQLLSHPRYYVPLVKCLNERHSTRTVGFLEVGAMDIVQNLPRRQLEKFQLKRLNSILTHSIKNVPFWQNQFQSQRVKLRTLADIERVPILTRNDINTRLVELVSRTADAQTAFLSTTSGSTTTPIRFYVGQELFFRRAFATRHALKVFGQNPWSTLLRLNYQSMPWSAHRGDYIDLIWARENVTEFHNFVKTHRHDGLFGTVSYLLLFADLAKQFPLGCQFKFIISQSEYLSPYNRDRLEKVFGCPVFNVYGTREFGPLAQECRLKDGFHLNEDRFFFEIVDEGGRAVKDNTAGRILVTSFDNRTMPFIRYEVGDLGRFVPGRCACGVQTKKMVFEGRSCDFICLPSGDRFPLVQLLHIVDLPGEIKAYQFVQNTKDSLNVRIVAGEKYTPAVADAVKKKILNKTRCDENRFGVTVELVDSIGSLDNGKRKILVSESA